MDLMKALRMLALVLALATGGFRAHAACPAGMTATSDGYCLRADQTYCGSGMACGDGMTCRSAGRCFYANGCWPGQVSLGKTCLPAGAVVCPGGRSYCDPGQQCTADGGCSGGLPNTGPVCPNGKRAEAGWLCAPDSRTYNPAVQKLCGTAICDRRAECGDNACASPFRQETATRATPAAPRVQAPTVRAPTAPTANTPTVSTPTPPAVSTPTVSTPTPPTVSAPTVSTPTPPTVSTPTVRTPSSPTANTPTVSTPTPPTTTTPQVQTPTTR
jgi:hypothetical protein